MKASLLPCTAPPGDLQQAPQKKRGRRIKIVSLMGLDGTSEGKLKTLLNQLDKQSFANKIAVDIICGKNERLKRQLEQRNWERLRVSILGFVKDVPQRLEQADLALLRLSPQIMTESLVAKTPVIAFDWHFHERENIRLLRKFGAGDGSRSTHQQIHLIKRYCKDAQLRRQWERAAIQMSGKRFSVNFVETVLSSAGKPSSGPVSKKRDIPYQTDTELTDSSPLIY